MGNRPDIIFFFTDQQRADTLGCYGQPLPVSPNLDKMAMEGTRYEHAFSPQPVCGPMRACIQTGTYATESGCYRNDIALPKNEKTIAHYCSEAGYELGYIGKWHLASTGPEQDFKRKPVPPELRGGWNDYWLASDVLEFTSTGSGGHMFDKDGNKVEFDQYRADAVTDYAIDFLRNRKDREKPYFLFISYLEPHHQNTTNRYEGPAGSYEKFGNFTAPEDLAGTSGDWEKSYPDYLGSCHSLDRNMGRIRDELKRQGHDENTLIIYTSDHGSHFRTRNSEYKRSCHESSIRVPLIISGPGFRNGGVEKKLISTLDLPPTILQAAGVKPPKEMKGRPLQQCYASTDWRDEVFIQISESQVGRAIRNARWKYSVRAPGKDGWEHSKSDVYIEDFLYDLESDPYEKKNLVKDPEYAGTRKELSIKLMKHMREAGEDPVKILPHTLSNRIFQTLKAFFRSNRIF